MEGRKRGAPKGNTNALKHGFYSRKFRVMENGDIDGIENANTLEDEIVLLKVVIRRVWEMASEKGDDLDAWTAALNTVGRAMDRMGHLMRIQSMIDGGSNEVTKAISEAIAQVTEEFNGCK